MKPEVPTSDVSLVRAECDCGSGLPTSIHFEDQTPLCAACRTALGEMVLAALRELVAGTLPEPHPRCPDSSPLTPPAGPDTGCRTRTPVPP